MQKFFRVLSCPNTNSSELFENSELFKSRTVAYNPQQRVI